MSTGSEHLSSACDNRHWPRGGSRKGPDLCISCHASSTKKKLLIHIKWLDVPDPLSAAADDAPAACSNKDAAADAGIHPADVAAVAEKKDLCLLDETRW